ncbi:hypothetical protein DFH28DRAFT_969151 [Melampsora americana]|nr:hypothetical protein DFH28DRAFT_969151 [Melampsora americana]
MDSADYSYGEGVTNLPDKTGGGVSKLGGITFGTDEDSFHSDEFDRELGKALAVGAARRQQSKKDKGFLARNLTSTADVNLSPDSSSEPNRYRDNGETSEKAGGADQLRNQRNTNAPNPQSGTRPTINHPNTPSRVTTRSHRPANTFDKLSPITSRNPSSKRRPSRAGASRLHNGPTSPDSPEGHAPEDSNMSSIHQTLNDSAAFALSPPASPEVSRRSSSNGGGSQLLAGKKPTSSTLPKRSLASDTSRGKGAHLTLREQEKVIDEVKKENFNLKLKIYFLEDRLAKLAPDQVDLALKENVEIKVEFQTVRQELKRYKRLLLEAERAIAQAKAERDEVILQQTLQSQTGSPRLQDKATISRLESELRQCQEQLTATKTANAKKVSDLEADLRQSKAKLGKGFHQDTEVSSLQARNNNKANEPRLRQNQNIDDWVKEEHLLEIKNLKSELTEERQSREDLMADHQDLRFQLLEAQNALHDTRYAGRRSNRVDDLGVASDTMSRTHSRLDDHDEYGRRSTNTPASTTASANRIKDLKKEVDNMHSQMAILEDENASLRSQITAQVTMLTTRNSEKDKLQDQVHNLKRQVIELEEDLQRGDCEIEKIQNRNNDPIEGDELREELNLYRDKLASALLNLEKREKEIDELNQELQERENLYAQQMDQVNQECSTDLESAKAEMDHLQDMIDEREDQLERLSEQLRGIVVLQENTERSLRDTNAKLETKSQDLETALNELEATQSDLKEIGAGNRELAAEVEEKETLINSLTSELDELDREASNRTAVHEQVVSKLKQKLSNTKSELNELTIQYESCQSEVKFLREKHEELALRQAEMEERRRSEADARRRLERDVEDLERELRDAREENSMQILGMKKEKREIQASFQQMLDAKQKALSQAESELAHAKGRLEAREEDVEKMQAALKTVETESFRINESQSHDRFSLELEIERLHRDLANAAKDLSEAKLDVSKAQNESRSLNSKVITLQQERDEMNDQLDQVKESRRQLNENFEEQSKTIRQAQNELASAKDRIQTLEDDLSQDHKRLSKTETQYREQLSERNTLLLTIYQYIDKLVNSGSSLKKAGGQSDAKPFSNFSVFHDCVINRLRTLSAIQSGFDTKIKEFENRLEKQYASLKRQHDSRMRQLDQFETTIKAATDTQRQWRARLTTKQGEVESARETASELQKQISSLKQRASLSGSSPGSITEHKQAVNRASQLEKRLLATQTQLKTAEEKLSEAKVKVATAEGSWQARLRELQERNRELEEKVKRERQGAKERMNELTTQVQNLKEQVDASDRRGKQLDSVIKTQQG